MDENMCVCEELIIDLVNSCKHNDRFSVYTYYTVITGLIQL